MLFTAYNVSATEPEITVGHRTISDQIIINTKWPALYVFIIVFQHNISQRSVINLTTYIRHLSSYYPMLTDVRR